ncbi:hypothetical protein [Pseudomonas sp. PA27(2017)]|uniref:hypothetical protein n=1 Tax=Pseudomonas sp. PA27(2017) TaxID=1932112 RepID=UPI000960320D|nr:hypothetical protein [Pseudomonas sp. PA27(2017)]OLU35339.1 hypothetical protein BVH06_02995 [Pseudomonas sp. PA27(2017)]
MAAEKRKNLALAVGLNMLLPGLGYIYYGKWIVGFLGGGLVIAIAASNIAQNTLVVWVAVNVLMAIDMLLLNSRDRRRARDSDSMQCRSCAELIRAEAKKCRFCGEEVAQ